MKQIRQRKEFYNSYEHSETIASGQTGETITIPGLPAGKTIACTIIAGENSGYYQYSTSLDSEVAAETCNWITGDMGTVTGSETDVLIANVSAIKCISVSGQIKFEIKI